MADSTKHRVYLDKHFRVARVAQSGVSFLILYKNGITLLFHEFVWCWLKVGMQFVIPAFVEQDMISFSNVTVFCWPLALCILFLSRFPPRVSFPKKLCCQWALVILSLGKVTHRSLLLRRRLIRSSVGGQSRHYVRCGSVLEEAILFLVVNEFVAPKTTSVLGS